MKNKEIKKLTGIPRRQLVIPAMPCPVCGGRRFWYRKDIRRIPEWLCAYCDPPQDNRVALVVTIGINQDDGQSRERVRRMVKIMTQE